MELSTQSEIIVLVTSMANKLTALIEGEAAERLRQATQILDPKGSYVLDDLGEWDPRKVNDEVIKHYIAKPRPVVSPARRKSRILQGRYLGALRRVEGKDRARVKAVRAKRGHEAAIKLARRLGK